MVSDVDEILGVVPATRPLEALRLVVPPERCGRMKFAYADPPYMGQAHRYPEKTEVDHFELLGQLIRDFPDGWALSCSSTSLGKILTWLECWPGGMDYRVMAWVKPWASWKPTHRIQYAWEPVIVHGGRMTNLAKVPRAEKPPSVRDWVTANITMKKGLVGAKPEAFVAWLLDVLHVLPGDELVDVFPGTGIVSRMFAERTAA